MEGTTALISGNVGVDTCLRANHAGCLPTVPLLFSIGVVGSKTKRDNGSGTARKVGLQKHSESTALQGRKMVQSRRWGGAELDDSADALVDLPSAAEARVTDETSMQPRVNDQSAPRFNAELHALPEKRRQLIFRIRRQIAEGTYDTPERFDAAIDRLFDRVLAGSNTDAE